jgi:hypothetical protein
MNVGSIILLAILTFFAWVCGFDAGRRSVQDEAKQQPSYWRQTGTWLKQYFKQPGTVVIVLLFLGLIFFRVLIILIPALLVLLLR